MLKSFETFLIHADGRETKMSDSWTKQDAIDAADSAVQGRLPGCRAVVIRAGADPLVPALYEVESPAEQMKSEVA